MEVHMNNPLQPRFIGGSSGKTDYLSSW